MNRYYVIDGVLLVLALAVVLAILKYPKDFFLAFPLRILQALFETVGQFLILPLLIVILPVLWLASRYNWKIYPALHKFINLLTKRDRKKNR